MLLLTPLLVKAEHLTRGFFYARKKMKDLIQKDSKGNLTVSSLIIAELFGRRHSDVMTAIRKIDTKREISFSYKINDLANGKKDKYYLLTERQFLIAMPFIGGHKSIEGHTKLVDEFMRLRSIEQSATRHIDAIRSLLLLDAPAKWVKLYPDSFYQAIMALYGHDFDKAKNKPFYCAQITRRWIYNIVLPEQLQIEIDSIQGEERKHQWFNNEGGRETLIRQIAIVQTLAETSDNRADFESRCARKFLGEPLQLTVFK